MKWILFTLIGLIVLSIFCVLWFALKINSDFATEGLLEFHNDDTSISVTITDEVDVLILKQILNGRPFRNSSICPFSADISITMTNGKKSIVFCPANDGCPLLRIGNSGNKCIQITDEAKTKLHEVLEKYGMFFPCV